MEETQTFSKKKMSLKSKKMKAILVLVVAVVIGASIALALHYKNEADSLKENPAQAQADKNQAETDRVLGALKSVLFIGEQDAPTVARVEDPEKLKTSNQEFYKDIQKGDYLVIFPKRAIIFRESANQIMNIAPIINTADLQQKQAESSEQPAADTKKPTTTR